MLTRKSVLLGMLVGVVVLIPVAAAVYFSNPGSQKLADGNYDFSIKKVDSIISDRGTAVFKMVGTDGQAGTLAPEGKTEPQTWAWDSKRDVYDVEEHGNKIGSCEVNRLNAENVYPFSVKDTKGATLWEGKMKPLPLNEVRH
ncbi:MAG: hypothetical protein HY286_08410 [Planctomycetes bacterium]|nr:hypothetical protein [Planctomycetota bacterium]